MRGQTLRQTSGWARSPPPPSWRLLLLLPEAVPAAAPSPSPMRPLPPQGPSWALRSRTRARGDPKPESRPRLRARLLLAHRGTMAATTGDVKTTTPRRPRGAWQRANQWRLRLFESSANGRLQASGQWEPPLTNFRPMGPEAIRGSGERQGGGEGVSFSGVSGSGALGSPPSF